MLRHRAGLSLAEIAEAYAGRLTVAKVNIDDNPEAARRYGVRAIPTLILFKNGQAEASTMGVQSRSRLEALIDEHV